MMDEMKDNGTQRGYFFPAEKQRIKAIAKLIEIERQKQKNQLINKEQNKQITELKKAKKLFNKFEDDY